VGQMCRKVRTHNQLLQLTIERNANMSDDGAICKKIRDNCEGVSPVPPLPLTQTIGFTLIPFRTCS